MAPSVSMSLSSAVSPAPFQPWRFAFARSSSVHRVAALYRYKVWICFFFVFTRRPRAMFSAQNARKRPKRASKPGPWLELHVCIMRQNAG